MNDQSFEVHDPSILARARRVLDACRSPQEMQQAVVDAVRRNEEWRGQRCINLLAPEAPTSPTVRSCSAAKWARVPPGITSAQSIAGLLAPVH
jgi:glycine hydroxymethyltransferase